MLYERGKGAYQPAFRLVTKMRLDNPLRKSVRNFIIGLAYVAIVLICVAVGTASVIFPILVVGLAALAFSCWIVERTLRYPVTAFTTAMLMLPWSSFIRAFGDVYAPSVPLFVERFALEAILAVVAGSLALRKIKYGQTVAPGFRWTWEDLPVHLLMLAAIYGLILTLAQSRFSAAMFGVKVSVTPLICYYLLRTLRVDRDQIDRILIAFAVGYITIAVPSFYEYFVHPLFLFKLGLHARGMLNADVDKMRTWYSTAFFRMQSLMFHEDFWGSISGFASTYAIVRLFGGRSLRYLRVLAGLSTLGLALSMARGATMGWIVGMGIVLLTYKGKRIRLAVSLMIVGLLVGALYIQNRSDARIQYIEARASGFSPTQKLSEGSQVITKQSTFDGRTEQWNYALEMLFSQPSGFGLGTDGFAAEWNGNSPRFVSDGGYLRVGIEQGYFGFVLVMVGLACVPLTVLRRLRGINDPLAQALGVCLIAETASLFVQAVAGNAFDYPYMSHVYFIFFGLFMELTTNRNQLARASRASASRSINICQPAMIPS